MSGFEATTEELDALAKHIGNISDQIQGQARIVRDAASGVAAGWTGTAASAFQSLMARMDEDVAKLDRALQSIQEQVASTADVYARTEAEQEQGVGSIANRL